MNSKIGGQAVIEGVMMKNAETYAVAVRKANGEIVIDKQQSNTNHGGLAKAPIIRGMVAFVDSLVIGMKTLTYSASLFEDEEENTKKTKEQSERSEKLLLGFTVVLSIIMAIGIFMILPWFLSQMVLSKFIGNEYLLAVVEGLLRLLIFVIYIAVISQMEDIKRVFMYHGAEHKSINCIENGLDLTVENVRKQSRCHKRCGTSFMFFVIIISIIVFMFIRVSNPGLQALIRVLLVPVIAGLSYELIRFMGSSDKGFVAVLSKPGFAFQNLTTREPDDDMIAVAIASVEAVFDWREFVEKVRESGEAAAEKPAKNKKAADKQKTATKKNSKVVVVDQDKLDEEAKAKAAAREEARARRKAEAEKIAKKMAEDEEAEAKRAAEEAAKAAEAEAKKAAEEAEKAAEAKVAEVKEALEVETTVVKEAVEAEFVEAKEVADTEIKSLRKDNGLSSLDKVLFVKQDTPAREFKDPLANAETKVRVAPKQDEDDEILNALDKFFDFKDKND